MELSEGVSGMSGIKWDGRTRLVAFYMLFYFVNAVTVSLENDTFQRWMGPEAASAMHYLAVGMVGIGTLCFALSRKIFSKVGERRLLMATLILVYVFGLSGMLLSINKFGAIVCAIMAGMLSGFLGGAVYYYLAIQMEGKPWSGFLFGVGTATGIVLQYTFWNTLKLKWVLVIILLVLFIIVTQRILIKPEMEFFENSLPYVKEDESWDRMVRRQFLLLLLISLSYEIYFCLTDVYLVQAFFQGTINSYAWPLLFRAVGFLCAGFFADLKKGKYFGVVVFCGLLPNLITSLSLSGLASGLILSMFYFAVGVQECFLAFAFMTLSVRSRHPEVWAGFGKVFYLFEALWALLIRVEISEKVFLLVQIGLLIFSLLLCTMGELNIFLRPVKQKKEEEDPLECFAVSKGLTPREKEVLQELLNSEDNMKDLAARLLLSERVLYRYVKNIHDKTGTTSRAGLVKVYYESRMQSEGEKEEI